MEALGIDGKLLFAQIVNFVLFFFIFKRFLAGPFVKFMDKQKKEALEKSTFLEKLEKEKEEMESREEVIVKKAQTEAAQIIADAKETAKKIEEKSHRKAQEEILVLKQQLKKQLEEEEKVLRDRVKQDVMSTSSELVRLVLKDTIDSKLQTQIVANLLKKADKLN